MTIGQYIFGILILILWILLIAKEISYFNKGWGLTFYLIDLKDQRGWIKPFPSKLERAWLLIAIIAKILLLILLAMLMKLGTYRQTLIP